MNEDTEPLLSKYMHHWFSRRLRCRILRARYTQAFRATCSGSALFHL